MLNTCGYVVANFQARPAMLGSADPETGSGATGAMCFSAAASFTVAGACAAAGVFAVLKCPAPRYLPLAGIPLAFAAQQAVEGLVWLQIGQAPAATAGGLFPAIFIFFATVFWPTYVPFAIRAEEHEPDRRWTLDVLLAIGFVISLAFLSRLVSSDTVAHVEGHHVRYTAQAAGTQTVKHWLFFKQFVTGRDWILAPYAGAVILSLFLCTLRPVRWFGAMVALALLAVLVLDRPVLVSVWCFCAATGSVLIALAMAQARGTKGPYRAA